MKIVYHHRVASRDGQYVHIEEIIDSLRKLGHRVEVAAPAVPEVTSKASHEGGLVGWLKSNIPGMFYELMEFAYSFLAFVRLAMKCLKHKPDAIYERYNIFLPSGIWVSRLLSIPLVLEVNAPLYEERSRYDGIALTRLAKWSERFVWRNADHIIVVTDVLKSILVDDDVCPDKISVIANGVDPDRFCPPKDVEFAKSKLSLQNCLVLGFTGYMRDWHGLDRVLNVMTQLPISAHFLVVGDGPAKDGLLSRANELGLDENLTITGVVSRDEITPYIDAFDIALQPQVVRYASPLKLFEYMAMAKAVLAPNVDNIKEVMQHEHNGLLFEGSDKSFESELARLCEDVELRGRLGEQARDSIFADNRRWDDNAQSTVNIIRRLIGAGCVVDA
ncbi:MAG: glycosyltransferase family 4 protein [Pseudomonadota bacterium]